MEKTRLNYSFLKAKIVENFGSQGKYADFLGITKQELSKKINNKASFTQDQLLKSVDGMKLDETDFIRCFFSKN